MDDDRAWFADETFWRRLFPNMFPAARFEQAGEEAAAVVALSGIAGGAALDLCCGPGRISGALSELGFAVCGVDRSRFLLGEARARNAGRAIEWVESDMRAFRREGAFDLACSLFTSFGYFDDEGEDLRVLRNLHASLRPGGALVIDVKGRDSLLRHFLPVSADRSVAGRVLYQEHAFTADCTRLANTWTLIEDGRAESWPFELRVYSGQELRALLHEAGFASVRLHGSLQGEPYGADSRRLVAVAHKG